MNKVQIDHYLWDQVWERLDEGLELDAAKLLELIATNPGDVAAWYQDHPLTAVATIEALVTTQPVSIQKINLSPMTYRVNEHHLVESMPHNGHVIYP